MLQHGAVDVTAADGRGEMRGYPGTAGKRAVADEARLAAPQNLGVAVANAAGKLVEHVVATLRVKHRHRVDIGGGAPGANFPGGDLVIEPRGELVAQVARGAIVQ